MQKILTSEMWIKLFIFNKLSKKRLSPKFQTAVTWKLFKLERSTFPFLLILPKVLTIWSDLLKNLRDDSNPIGCVHTEWPSSNLIHKHINRHLINVDNMIIMIIIVTIAHCWPKLAKRQSLTANAFDYDVNKPRRTGYIKTQLCLCRLDTQPLAVAAIEQGEQMLSQISVGLSSCSFPGSVNLG